MSLCQIITSLQSPPDNIADRFLRKSADSRRSQYSSLHQSKVCDYFRLVTSNLETIYLTASDLARHSIKYPQKFDDIIKKSAVLRSQFRAASGANSESSSSIVMEPYRSRALLESLKYLTASEVVAASIACRCWLSVCRSDEIWLSFLSEDGNRSRLAMSPAISPLQAYPLVTKSAVIIRDNRLLCYNLFTQQWTSTDLSISWDVQTATVITKVAANTLFCCGGQTRSKDTFTIDMEKGTGKLLPSMTPHRPFPGVCHIDRLVYSFGGHQYLKTSQRFNLDTVRWEPLPNTTYIHKAFNPVVHGGLIYLPNGYCAYTELFDPKCLTFSVLKFTTDMVYSTTSLIRDDKRVIIGLDQVCVYDLSTHSVSFPSIDTEMPTAWSLFDVVVWGEAAVLAWPSGTRCALAFVDLKTFAWRTVDVPDGTTNRGH